MRRVLNEGGPTLLGAFVGAALLDEMCLTSAPLLVGGGAVRITAGSDDVLLRMSPAHVITDADGYLYTRYIRSP
jgi:riboflavin biosynthesis pyrimidine reductase